jgi:hypothetical protein
MRKVIIGIMAVAMLAIIPAAASAATTVPYQGNGFTGGLLNTQVNTDGHRYLLWVLSANGATSATIKLPDGNHAMTKVGGTFKYESAPFKAGELTGVTASYEGSVKGTVRLTVSHGYLDTNIPSCTSFDKQTGTGTSNIAGPFTMTETFTGKTWWSATDMDERWQQTVNVSTRNADVTPILGDFTGEIVGQKISVGSVIERQPSVRTGTFMPDGVTVNYGHYNWGGNYTVGASASIEYTDLKINGVPVTLCS